MKLSILMTKGYRLLSLAAVVDVFDTVNMFMEQEGKPKFFDIQFVGLQPDLPLPDHTAGHAYFHYRDSDLTSDLIFIPAFGAYEMDQSIQQNMPFIPWLAEQHQKGIPLASLCTGSFLLGASGLLDHKNATTHIDAVVQFAQIFPQVKLQPHAVITQDSNIYTSGGATNSFHLKLLLIQKYCGRAMAISIAKMFAIDMDRTQQLYFDSFKPSLTDTDDLVKLIQQKINDEFAVLKNVEEAIADIPSSRRNFIRRFKQSTGMTPIHYLQKTKIEAAKKLLETTNKGLLDIMMAAGYNDMKNFRSLFKKSTGLTPVAYRNKFGMKLA